MSQLHKKYIQRKKDQQISRPAFNKFNFAPTRAYMLAGVQISGKRVFYRNCNIFLLSSKCKQQMKTRDPILSVRVKP